MFTFPSVVHATVAIPHDGGVPYLHGLNAVFENIVSAVLGFAAIALFVMLLSGGFKYMTSGGDPKAAGSARNTLTYAIGGFILLAAAFFILRLLGVITGASDIENFNIIAPP